MSATPAQARRITFTPQAWDRQLSEVKISPDDLNRLVMDYLVVEGYKDAAQTFCRESGIAPRIDFDSIAERLHIRQAIQRGDIEEALQKVNDMNPEILDTNPELFFHLQQQRLIELIRQGQVASALQFAQDELAPRGEEHPEFLAELEKTMALLAFDLPQAVPDVDAFLDKLRSEGVPAQISSLLLPAQRQRTAGEVNAAILVSQSHGPTPKLPHLVKMMAWGEEMLSNRADFPKLELRALLGDNVQANARSTANAASQDKADSEDVQMDG
ncbi:uncharacterized protein L969DRAFT_59941 [Mixia osmundae IAM 14324]|uniref:CTLH domain-containing protein n=1 Tax=Mixia osmundae (strain CBS 9802 / IAM 14324 / JCM 22182 / KY 12970) TaxID=764103 RepID=G7EAR3_MIXOS|nr:uncharacterized protein L969DRAFT_59941 [Mixia osmundae IAM 14324]KEI40892.1 hypothetical protein L969DRAFT_59941 [Mixia osmundae IAM 14324]GAA99923.1 hypothetical protein E5Q_06626 [Mixia osmundae IAM 14324]